MNDLRIASSFDNMITKAKNKVKVIKMKIISDVSSLNFKDISRMKKILNRATNILDIIDSNKNIIMSKIYQEYTTYDSFKKEFHITIINKGDDTKLIIALSQILDRPMMKSWWLDFNKLYQESNPEQKL